MSITTLASHGLSVAQVVQVNRGALSGLTGVLIGVRGDRCLIELNRGSGGALLLIDVLAVSRLD